MRTLTFTLLLLSSFCLHAQPDCSTLEEGRTWQGYYTLNSDGTELMMSMTIETMEDCTITGILYFHDFFNSSIQVSGGLKGDVLELREEKILSGIHMDLGGVYELTDLRENFMKGYAGSDDHGRIAQFKLYPEGSKVGLKKNWASEKAAAARKYGQCTIGDRRDDVHLSDLKALLDSASGISSSDTLPFVLRGKALYEMIEMDLYMFSIPPDEFYMRLRLMGYDMMEVVYDTTYWSYNAMENELIIEHRGEDDEDGMDLMFRDLYSFDIADSASFQVTGIWDAIVDSTECYKVVLDYGWMVTAAYIDKSTGLIQRIDNESEVTRFSDYTLFGEELIPHKFTTHTIDEDVSFIIEEFTYTDTLTLAHFEVPEEIMEIGITVTGGDHFNELGNELLEKGLFEEAVLEYNKAIAQDLSNGIYYYNRGSAKLEMGDYYGAISDFNQSEFLYPGFAPNHNKLGLAKYYMNDIPNALKDFNRAVELDPTLTDPYINRGFTFMRLEDFEASIRDFEQLIKMEPDNGDYHHYLGRALVEIEEYETALESYRKGISLGSEESDNLNYMGVCLHRLGQYEEALTLFERAIAGDPTDFDKAMNYGRTLYDTGLYDEAVDQLTALSAELPDNAEIFNYIGMAQYQLGNYTLAKLAFTEALERDGQNANYYDNRAYSSKALMEYEEAIADFSLSIDAYSRDPEVYFERGLLKILLNNRYDGCKDLKVAADMGHEEALLAIREKCSMLEDDAPDNKKEKRER